MCGRYSFAVTPTVVTYFNEMGLNVTTGCLFNITPTESLAIIMETDGQRECYLARWWLLTLIRV
ncbi:MAG: putative SOS response-associated peptidase YedK [Oceanicoccus sp.]|jgi:putative SOS response-associated peptidase YedK